MGYTVVSKSIVMVESVELGTIVLHESFEDLDDINIIAKRPTLKNDADRLVFKVDNTPLIEGDMLKVLKTITWYFGHK